MSFPQRLRFQALAAAAWLRFRARAAAADTLLAASDDAHLVCTAVVALHAFALAPAKSIFDLLSLTRACSNHSCGIRPSCLRNIRQSAQYALAVAEDDSIGKTVLVPCQKVVALVRSSHKSKPEQLDNGFNLVTNGVQDVIPAGGDAPTPEQEFTLTTMCTAENLTQYKLDPPRGQKQHALVTTTVTSAGEFVVETVQHVSSEDANVLTTSMTTWARLAKELVLGDVSSPASAKKCRVLGRCWRFGGNG